MTTVVYNSVELQGLVGTFTGGLGGAPSQIRASQRAKAKAINFTFVQTAGANNATDYVKIARLFPTDYLLDWMMNITANAPGANILMNMGKIDDYGTANNAFFDSAIPIANLGVIRPGQSSNGTALLATITSKLPVQVGTDPVGDQSSAQGVPNFGSGPITVTFTLYNGSAANNASYAGYLLVGTGQ